MTKINKFEKKFAKIINKKYATTVSERYLRNSIKSTCIKKGDEVIIPNFTIIYEMDGWVVK